MDYLYDGSFDGLLTCIYHHYYREAATGIYPVDCYQPNLLSPSMVVETEPALADRVYRAIVEKISSRALETVYHVYISSAPKKENLIWPISVWVFRWVQGGSSQPSGSVPVHRLSARLPARPTACWVCCVFPIW